MCKNDRLGAEHVYLRRLGVEICLEGAIATRYHGESDARTFPHRIPGQARYRRPGRGTVNLQQSGRDVLDHSILRVRGMIDGALRERPAQAHSRASTAPESLGFGFRNRRCVILLASGADSKVARWPENGVRPVAM